MREIDFVQTSQQLGESLGVFLGGERHLEAEIERIRGLVHSHLEIRTNLAQDFFHPSGLREAQVEQYLVRLAQEDGRAAVVFYPAQKVEVGREALGMRYIHRRQVVFLVVQTQDLRRQGKLPGGF